MKIFVGIKKAINYSLHEYVNFYMRYKGFSMIADPVITKGPYINDNTIYNINRGKKITCPGARDK